MRTPAANLSVPSSSGKGLQLPLIPLLQPHRSLAFSPLFIGEGSSTAPACGSPKDCIGFQSPLHRGRVFNPSPGSTPPTTISFSPLFIGEGSSTRAANLRAMRARLLSVPSSSGKGLQRPSRLYPTTAALTPFSPLFIGEGSSTSGTCSTLETSKITFSPLFIGEGSSTISEDDLHLVLVPFSPLFIGEGSSTEEERSG